MYRQTLFAQRLAVLQATRTWRHQSGSSRPAAISIRFVHVYPGQRRLLGPRVASQTT